MSVCVVGLCYCCNEEIDSKNFETGHIISVKNGGETVLENLKPICSCCNKSMGIQNLEEFKNKYMKQSTSNIDKKSEPVYWNDICNELFSGGNNYSLNLRNQNNLFM